MYGICIKIFYPNVLIFIQIFFTAWYEDKNEKNLLTAIIVDITTL